MLISVRNHTFHQKQGLLLETYRKNTRKVHLFTNRPHYPIVLRHDSPNRKHTSSLSFIPWKNVKLCHTYFFWTQNEGRRHQISVTTIYICNSMKKLSFVKIFSWYFGGAFSSLLLTLNYIGHFSSMNLCICLWKFGFFFIKETLSTLSSFNRLVNIWETKIPWLKSNKAAINRGNATLFEIVLLPLHRTPHNTHNEGQGWKLTQCVLA